LVSHASNQRRATTDNQRAVWDALAALPVENRQAIALCLFAGMSYRQVAAHLDLPERIVQRRIRMGMRALAHATGG
jgi:RNA polymerase sigma factor (sigma-70 family)